MRSRWKLVTLLSLVLLLLSSVISCAPSYTQEQLDAISQENYELGEIDGYAEGYEEGYKEGKDDGYKEGKAAGLTELRPELTSTQKELSSTKQTLTETQEELEVIEAELLLSNTKVTNLSVSPYYVDSGEKVTISTTVTNSGSIQVRYTAILRINGSEVGKKSVVLDAGESKVVIFTVAKASTGNYKVELGGLVGTFVVVGSQVIKDLAYIEASAVSYSDDDDPEHDAISVQIAFYDSKSKRITFQDIPVSVIIELVGCGRSSRWICKDRESVYRDQVNIDHSGAKITIPYNTIDFNRNRYYEWGYMEVMVTTPKQYGFQATTELIMLYLYPED
ncbi:CARDB domain-containing protein [Chloroflexota bacterium]